MPVLFIWMIYYSKLALLKITNSWIEKQEIYAIKFCKKLYLQKIFQLSEFQQKPVVILIH